MSIRLNFKPLSSNKLKIFWLNRSKLKRHSYTGVNVAKTMTTGQGVLGAALCFISGPVGVAVAGIGAAATGATFCVGQRFFVFSVSFVKQNE